MYQLNDELSKHFSVRLEPKYGETIVNGFDEFNSTTIDDKGLNDTVVDVLIAVEFVIVGPLGFVVVLEVTNTTVVDVTVFSVRTIRFKLKSFTHVVSFINSKALIYSTYLPIGSFLWINKLPAGVVSLRKSSKISLLVFDK